MLKKIILVFKTHFDIGFTDLSSKVIDKYVNSILKEVIATCKATEDMGKLKYVWTMPSWPLKVITERCDPDLKKELYLLIERGQIVWHALPFTSHTDFCSAEEYIEGLRFGRELSEKYNKPYTISAKMTDVPGHSIMLPQILSGAGVKFLHLGCNEFSHPPELPFLFHWQATSGERVLTMYKKGGYGTSLLPPENWNYPVWMALMQTHDNCGPQSAVVIEKMIKKINIKYPDTEVVCGTMDDFYKDLSNYDLKDIPIITNDLADTWIHGIGAYPKEVGIVREERERSKRLQAMTAKQFLERSSKFDPKITDALDQYYENISLFEEHTWGADVKTFLGPDRVYNKEEFLKTKVKDNYQFMEESWQEQRDRAYQSSHALNEMKILLESNGNGEISMFNPGHTPFTGWVAMTGSNLDFNKCSIEMKGELLPITKIDGDWACFVRKLPPFVTTSLKIVDRLSSVGNLQIKRENDLIKVENHRYIITFSEKTGNILELFDRKMDTVLLKKRNEKSIFMYQYDRYGMEDMTSFLRDYAYRFSTWGVQDFGREAYPECEHKTYYPEFKSYSIENDSLILSYKGTEGIEKYGDAEEIIIEITLPPVGDEIFINLNLKNKQETPYIESASFLFPFAEEEYRYGINKANTVLDPATDIQKGANHVFYCLENYITAVEGQNGLCIIAKDSPLVSLGNTGVYRFMNNYRVPEEPIAYFNLFNNMWGTNFPQWIGGDFSFRYVLFGFEKEYEKSILERATILKEGVELTGNRLKKGISKFPKHMQLINVRNVNSGMILRFRDLFGEKALRSIQINDYNITPVNLHNMVKGEKLQGKYEFVVNPYGIYSFLISPISKN